MKRFLLNCVCFFLLISVLTSGMWIYARKANTNAYVLARIDKKKILENTKSPKVVFVGGSNLAFGIDCSQIKDSIGIPCVNMGLHAGQGMKFILDDIDPYIKAMNKDEGNIIVLMPEFPHFFGDISNGGSTTMGEIFLTDPHSIEIMGLEQKILVLKGVPKLLTGTIMENLITPPKDTDFKYLRNNFDEEGDEIGHLQMEYDNTRTAIPPHIYLTSDLNKDFCEYFKNKVVEWKNHATVVIFPETIYMGYLEDNKEKLALLDKELEEMLIPYYTDLDEFSYPYDKMFKAPEHITKDGVIENSGRVGHLLKQIIAEK